MKTKGAIALDFIDQALKGGLSLEDACRFLSGLDPKDYAVDAAHAVVHFVTDADLRARDVAYDALLRRELEGHAQRLRTLLEERESGNPHQPS